MGKFLFMADAHIRNRTWTNSMQLAGDAYAALNKVTGQLPGEVDSLVIGGDWFDSNRPSSEDLVRTLEFLHGFSAAFYVRGNHDSCVPSFLEALSAWDGGGVYELTADAGIAGTCQCRGVSWLPSADQVKELILRARDASNPFRPLYLVLHASFKHLLGFDGTYQLDAEWIKDVFKDRCVRVLVGDIHTRHTMELPNRGWIHSPGALYPRSWDKVREPCFVSLVDTATGDIEDVPCGVRRYEQLEYAGMPELLEALHRLSEEREDGMLDTFVRVVLPEGCSTFSRPSVPGVQVQAVSAVDDSEEVPGETPQTAADDRWLLDAVREECGDDADLADMAGALLSSDDPLKEIEEWLSYWKVERIA